ncbi:MAG: UDP-N-acetylmuramoyl-tripeptide--D-alanyl-D-alanine ligase [Bacteroidota bacterium]
MQNSYINTEQLYQIFRDCDKKICTDSRNPVKDSIFFALSGENFDGNKFAQDALDKGCKYAVINNPENKKDERFLLVEEVLIALQKLAQHHRHQFSIPVIAITGSNGKTTTKELIYEVLSKKYKTLATIGNLNNHIGVPLTLLRLDPTIEIAIIEMGANHQGEIAMLSEIASPDYGVITNIGKAHLEGFGGVEGVKKGKGELYDFLRKNEGMVFYHADDDVLSEMAFNLQKKFTYGTNKLYDIVGKVVSSEQYIEFKWKTRYGASSLNSSEAIKTNLVGRYNYYNLLCAVAIGNFFKVEEEQINNALRLYLPSNNRSQMHLTENNKLILDMYNANPSSMQAALENFAQLKTENKMVILGDMLELGSETESEHQKVIQLAGDKKFECYFVGKNFFTQKDNHKGVFFQDVKQAQIYFNQNSQTNKTILIKGSRGIKLEELLGFFS